MLNRAIPVLALLPLLLSGCGDDPEPQASGGSDESVSGELLNAAGESMGTVTLTFEEGRTVVDVQASDLPPGQHGFHVHKTGRCEPDSPDPADPSKTGDFLSAGGHLSAEGQDHGDHDGDLPALLVARDGSGTMTVASDRLPSDQVLDDDGSAIMVHELPDNAANIPERYAPDGPDEATRKTGDSGGRIACAALSAA